MLILIASFELRLCQKLYLPNQDVQQVSLFKNQHNLHLEAAFSFKSEFKVLVKFLVSIISLFIQSIIPHCGINLSNIFNNFQFL